MVCNRSSTAAFAKSSHSGMNFQPNSRHPYEVFYRYSQRHISFFKISTNPDSTSRANASKPCT